MWRDEGEKTDESRVKREWRLGIKGSMGDPFEEFCYKMKQRDGEVAGRGCGIRRGFRGSWTRIFYYDRDKGYHVYFEANSG